MPGGGARVRALLNELGVRPDHRRGQHFLVDDSVLTRQVQAAQLDSSDTVLEIGAGLGVLTRELAERAGTVVTYESDRRLAEHLREEVPGNVDLRAEDALKAEWPSMDKVVANIPYSISSPLLFRILETPMALAVLLLQREFADRLVAKPRTKAYGRLTVSTARLAKVELLEVVPPTAFYPQPKVESALVRLVPEERFQVTDRALFDELLRVVFSARRKMLKNSLQRARQRLAPGASPEVWSNLLASLEWSEARPEAISPADFGHLANEIARLGDIG
jgi:16S rRNA (adenine1518-N6/adenine1519-N6)-dimethyltransferase